MKSTKREEFKSGILAAMPIIFGYFPVAMAFGLLAKNAKLSLINSGLFSIMSFAGASQFMALDLINSGVSHGNIMIATFLLNLRHLMMSASLSLKVKDIDKKFLPIIAFGITDETFSLAAFKEEKLTAPFLLALNFSSYLSWVSGSFAGYLLGEILPSLVQVSLGIGLYGMFVGILVPVMKRSNESVVLAFIGGLNFFIISKLNILPSGWDIIVATVISAGIGALIFSKKGSGKAKC